MTSRTLDAVRAVEAERRRRRGIQSKPAGAEMALGVPQPLLPHGTTTHGLRPPFWEEQVRLTNSVVLGGTPERVARPRPRRTSPAPPQERPRRGGGSSSRPRG
jgi:hypothetical protein